MINDDNMINYDDNMMIIRIQNENLYKGWR